MIHYILQIIAFQLLFLLVYDLFLKKETFFNLNRVYLLITPLLSFVLPLIQISIIRDQVPQDYLIELPAVLIDTSATHITLPEVFLGTDTASNPYLTIGTVLLFLWSLGAVVCAWLFFYKIRVILKLKNKGVKNSIESLNLISLPQTNTAFSFFNTIFLGESLSEDKKAHILLHEKVHVTEYHSYDLLFFEILRVVFWFNPSVYVYQKRMTLLQEYIADAKAVLETDKKTYYQGLLSQVFQTDKISFINTFFNHSLIKSRIVMLQKSKSKKIVQLRYLLLIPVVCSMLVYTSCSQDTIAQETEQVSEGDLMQKIEAVKQHIETQGTISDEEKKAISKLVTQILNTDAFSKTTNKDASEKLTFLLSTSKKFLFFQVVKINLNKKPKIVLLQK